MASERTIANGCYTITNPDGGVSVESSEIRALRKAVAFGGKVSFTKWGDTVGGPVSQSSPEPASATKAAAPKATASKAASEPVVAPAKGDPAF